MASLTVTRRPAEAAKAAKWDFGLWLLVGLPIVALVACLVAALLNPDGLLRPDFGYDQWLPAAVQADESGQ